MAKKTPQPPKPGNIDTRSIAPVRNRDGSVSTVRSISIGTDSGEVLIPTVVRGRVVSNEEAIAEFRRSGRHLGVFASPREATEYAKQLHKSEEKRTAPRRRK
jgi:hypothetical protein